MKASLTQIQSELENMVQYYDKEGLAVSVFEARGTGSTINDQFPINDIAKTNAGLSATLSAAAQKLDRLYDLIYLPMAFYISLEQLTDAGATTYSDLFYQIEVSKTPFSVVTDLTDADYTPLSAHTNKNLNSLTGKKSETIKVDPNDAEGYTSIRVRLAKGNGATTTPRVKIKAFFRR